MHFAVSFHPIRIKFVYPETPSWGEQKSSGEGQLTSKKVHAWSDLDRDNSKDASTVILMDNYCIIKHFNLLVKPNSNLYKYFHHTSKNTVRRKLGPPLLEETGCILENTLLPESILNSNSAYFPLKYKTNPYLCNNNNQKKESTCLNYLYLWYKLHYTKSIQSKKNTTALHCWK